MEIRKYDLPTYGRTYRVGARNIGVCLKIEEKKLCHYHSCAWPLHKDGNLSTDRLPSVNPGWRTPRTILQMSNSSSGHHQPSTIQFISKWFLRELLALEHKWGVHSSAKKKKKRTEILFLPQMYKDRYSPSAPAEKYEMPSLDEFLSGNLFHPPSGTGPGTRARNSCQICAKTKQEDKKYWSKKSYCKFTQKKNSQKLIFHTRRRKIMIDYKGVPKYRWPSTTSTKVNF